MAKMRVEDKWAKIETPASFYYLDLLSNRSLSNTVASSLGIDHESPQLILVKNGRVTYDASHFDINVETLNESLLNQHA